MRVAAAQAASVWLDRAATSRQVVGLLEEASRHDVELVTFPERLASIRPITTRGPTSSA